MHETIDYTQPTDRRPALTGVVISPTALSDLFFNHEKPNYSEYCASKQAQPTDFDEMFAAILEDAQTFVQNYLEVDFERAFAYNLASDFWHRL
jgi:hypothetical protein